MSKNGLMPTQKAELWKMWNARFGGRSRCTFCGVPKILPTRLTLDHIVPLSEGGSNATWNIQPLCSLCHALKGLLWSMRAREQLASAKGLTAFVIALNGKEATD